MFHQMTREQIPSNAGSYCENFRSAVYILNILTLPQ